MSQSSEGAFSAILTDVDGFIEEAGIHDDVDCIMAGSFNTDFKVDEDTKPVLNESLDKKTTSLLQCDNILQYPPELPQCLTTDEYSGTYNFSVVVLPNNRKPPWEYSSKLRKIFIMPNQKIPIAFNIEREPIEKLYIRVTPIFSQSQYFQDTVHRCLIHQNIDDASNKNVESHIIPHVVRCTNDAVKYFGDLNANERLSLVLPLGKPLPGCETVKEYFSFVCASSCTGGGGMNRRPIEVVFSLENVRGDVLGRRIMAVRICSCPKRDREKQEKELEPSGKRIKLEMPEKDLQVFKLNLNIVGRNNYLDVLKYAQKSMAFETLLHKEEIFKKCFNHISKEIEMVTKQ